MDMRQEQSWQAPKLEQKLIFLYLLKQMEGEDERQLMQVALQLLYTDYFQYTLVREALLEQGFICLEAEEGQRTERCSFLPQGQRVLEILEGDIPLPLRQSVLRAVENWRQGQQGTGRQEGGFYWHFHEGPGPGYVYLHSQGLGAGEAAAHCGLDLRLPCGDATEARRLAKRWEALVGGYYRELVLRLRDEGSEG